MSEPNKFAPPAWAGRDGPLHEKIFASLATILSTTLRDIGAAIGREFSYALVTAVVRKPEAELESALNRLIEAGLLFRQGVSPHASCLFKHALVQDADYSTMLREPRRALHARIAETDWRRRHY